MSKDDYNEGFSDCAKIYDEKYISRLDLADSFDKFLDLINKHLYILRCTKNHFNGIGVDKLKLETKSDIDHNFAIVTIMIDEALKQTIKEKTHGQTQKKY